MKKLLKNLKFITLVFVAVIGTFVSTKEVQAAMVYTAFPIQYIVSNTNFPPTAYAGGDRTICLPTTSVTIPNASATDADGSIASTSWELLPGPVPIVTITPASTGAGASPMSLPTTISGMTATGPYIFRLTVTDNEGLINTDVITITVNTAGSCATGPDLIISTDPYSSSATVTAGITTTMIAIVKNDGTLVTGPDPITHLFKFDDDTNHSTGVTYATSISGYIHPGNTTSISTPHTFTTSGTRYVSACADLDEDSIPANGTVTPELDETNNCSTWTAITVQGPAVPVVTITASPTSGDVDVVNPTIIWSATETPTSCTASGDWTGSRSVPTGNQSQGILTSVRTYTYTLTCTNAIGPSAPASATVVVNDGTTNVNGACGTTHYACTAGANVPPLSGTNQDPGTSSTDPWTWTCPGSGGGVSASCSEPFTVPKQCNDTVDNDGDGLKDTLDPGCHSDGDATNASSYVPTDDKEKNIKPIWIEI